MTEVYAVSNHKGGVGKTTSTINIGAGFVTKNKKVLLIDLDPQCDLTNSFGIKKPDYTMCDYLKGETFIKPIEVKNNLYVFPSSLDLSALEMDLFSEPGREYVLREFIEKISDQYDYILIDCPPALGLLTINALSAADYVLIPLQAEYLPMQGLAKLTEIIQKIKNRLNPKLQLGGVFLTQYDHRKVLNRDTAKSIKDFFKEKALESKISNNISLAEAPSQHQDIFLYAKNSNGAQDYLNLCKELLEKKAE